MPEEWISQTGRWRLAVAGRLAPHGGPCTMLFVQDGTDWLALRRVHEVGITTRHGRYVHHGQPVADYLAAALDDLIRTEHLALGRAIPSGHQQVCVSRAGQARYAELNGNGVGGARR